jgi:hypothetical protein
MLDRHEPCWPAFIQVVSANGVKNVPHELRRYREIGAFDEIFFVADAVGGTDTAAEIADIVGDKNVVCLDPDLEGFNAAALTQALTEVAPLFHLDRRLVEVAITRSRQHRKATVKNLWDLSVNQTGALPNYSVEQLKRSLEPRLAHWLVRLGADPLDGFVQKAIAAALPARGRLT